MTINSKRNIVGMVAGLGSVAAYIVYVRMGNAPAPEDIATWAKLMLVFIGISVAVQIVIQILFEVVFSISIGMKERGKDGEKTKMIVRATMREDEREKLINLKALRVGYTCAGTGLLIALFALAGGASYVAALHMIVGAGAAGSLVEGCAGIFFHERGVRNG